MKVAFFNAKSYDKEFFDKASDGYNVQIDYIDASLQESTAQLAAGRDCVCVFVNDKISASILEKLKNYGVKMVALRCAGFNNVDLEAADKFGVKIYRVPGYAPNSVAEHAMALILTLNRKTHKAYNRVREGNFSLERLTGFEMYGKTIGVIGTGKIGKAFCDISLGFGCKVLAFDKYENTDLKNRGVIYSNLESVIKSSDIISLHCPLTPETHHMIKKETILKMKEGVMLVNTSRGGLINTKDVIEGLKNRHIGGLAIDVYEQEESLFFRDLSETVIEDFAITRLMTFPNVLITAHQAFFTEKALTQIAETTLKNIEDFSKGKSNENIVTLEAIA